MIVIVISCNGIHVPHRLRLRFFFFFLIKMYSFKEQHNETVSHTCNPALEKYRQEKYTLETSEKQQNIKPK